MNIALKGGSRILVCETSYDEICYDVIRDLNLRKHIDLERAGKFIKVWAGSRAAANKFYREFFTRRGLYH